ncbi:MAG: hypothetical protein NW226_16840 [Microscillaceae bacterium]|nr:hypothetical protein [Microscillaceae bacterium]
MEWWHRLLVGIAFFVAWSWLIFKIGHFEKYLKYYTPIVQILVSLIIPIVGLWIDFYTTLITFGFFVAFFLVLIAAYSSLGKK